MPPQPVPETWRHGPWRLSMGISRLDPAHWLMPDAAIDEELEIKRRLLADDEKAVLDWLPEAEVSARELLALLIEHLPVHHADRFAAVPGGVLVRPTGETAGIDAADPLRAAGLLVQEDLCLMAARPDGYTLVGASLSFPSRWRLAEKLGRPLDAIHAPVPGLVERLGATTERFFKSLELDKPVWRANWSVIDRPELHQPTAPAQRDPIDPGDAGRSFWLRVERQTLRRLPLSRHVLFTIRTFVRPLHEAAAEPIAAAALAARLRELPEAMRVYKGIATHKAWLLDWLDARAVSAALTS